MIKYQRHKRILSILEKEGAINLVDLHRALPEVSSVTLRRDMAELADAGALKRTHGGAILPDAKLTQVENAPRLVPPELLSSQLNGLDAIILPPINEPGGNALRRQIVRSGIPFLAESASQTGGVYLGPDNAQAANSLGVLAGEQTEISHAVLLMICHPDLKNTQERAASFESGFRSAYRGDLTVIKVNGQGIYKAAFRVALDAFKMNENISVVFGVNDHSALAGIEAGERADRDISVYATGGESPNFVGRLAERGALRAVAAFFPEVVGARGIDLIVGALAGRPLKGPCLTPHEILTGDNLEEFYVHATGGWTLRETQKALLINHEITDQPSKSPRGQIGILPHFPAHDWYRIMIQSMQSRAERSGFELVVSAPHQGIASEIARLRREIAATAVQRIEAGQTIIIAEGEATQFLADEIRRLGFENSQRFAGVTVITNALDVMFRLEDVPPLKVILTSGEYQKHDRCLVGPSLGALFERMRADIAFLSVAGVSPEFGLSSLDERLALTGSRFAAAAKYTVALADHTVIGADANHRIVRLGEFHEVITDDGALPSARQSLRSAGVEVLVANEAQESAPQSLSERVFQSG